MRLGVNRSILDHVGTTAGRDELIDFAGIWEDPEEVERKRGVEEERRNRPPDSPRESMAMDFVNGNGWMWGF